MRGYYISATHLAVLAVYSAIALGDAQGETGSIRARIVTSDTGAGIAGLDLNVTPMREDGQGYDWRLSRATRSDDGGIAVLDSLPVSEYEIRQGPSARKLFSPDGGFHGYYLPLSVATISVQASKTTEVTILARPGGSVRGQVVVSDGEPEGGLRVITKDSNLYGWLTHLPPDGRFRIDGLKPDGPITLYLHCDRDGGWQSEVFSRVFNFGATTHGEIHDLGQWIVPSLPDAPNFYATIIDRSEQGRRVGRKPYVLQYLSEDGTYWGSFQERGYGSRDPRSDEEIILEAQLPPGQYTIRNYGTETHPAVIVSSRHERVTQSVQIRDGEITRIALVLEEKGLPGNGRE